MKEILLHMLLIAAAVAMPVWMARRKTNQRPWLVGWLLVVGLLMLPFGLTLWLHPEWLDQPVPFLAKYLVLMPGLLSLCALGGGLVYLLAPLALALLLGIGKAFGEAFKDVEWRQDEEEEINYWDDCDPRNPYAFERHYNYDVWDRYEWDNYKDN